MAFFGRVGNILRHAANRKIGSELCSLPSVFQATRCTWNSPNSKLFIGGAFDLQSTLCCTMKCLYIYIYQPLVNAKKATYNKSTMGLTPFLDPTMSWRDLCN